MEVEEKKKRKWKKRGIEQKRREDEKVERSRREGLKIEKREERREEYKRRAGVKKFRKLHSCFVMLFFGIFF